MKAIILAAGEGKRLRPLTLEVPKPLVRISGKPILERIWDSLPEAISEVILVVGYKNRLIRDYFGNEFRNKKIHYVYQEKPLGTAHALMLCKSFINKREKFLFMYSDDLHGKNGLSNLLNYELAVLVAEHPDPKRFGVVLTDKKNKILEIEEKPDIPKSNLVAVGAYVFDDKIFNYKFSRNPNGEYYVTDLVGGLIKDYPVYAEKTSFWHPIGYPEDVDAAEKKLLADWRNLY